MNAFLGSYVVFVVGRGKPQGFSRTTQPLQLLTHEAIPGVFQDSRVTG